MARRAGIVLVAVALATGTARASGGAPDVTAADRAAARASGLAQLRAVPASVVSARRLDAVALRLLTRAYPPAARHEDAALYTALGLTGSLQAELRAAARSERALYDRASRRLYLRADAGERSLVAAAVRALADQHYGRAPATDRDAAAGAEIALAGTAALAAGEQPPPATTSGTPLHRFLSLERTLTVAAGRRLVSQLRFYGGMRAARGALARPPATTAQALHLDRFLERDVPDGVAPLPPSAGGGALAWTQTFGELDVRALLGSFRVANAAAVAAEWNGGRSGAYRLPDGTNATVLELGWSDDDAATAWFGALHSYVTAAFPAAAAAPCREAACWIVPGGALAFSFRDTSSVLVAAPTLSDATALTDALL